MNQVGNEQNQEEKPKVNPYIEKFQCKICLDIANEPVITPCGHLYCWNCIYQWAEKKQNEDVTCPFCFAKIELSKLTTIFTGEEESKEYYSNQLFIYYQEEHSKAADSPSRRSPKKQQLTICKCSFNQQNRITCLGQTFRLDFSASLSL